MDNGEENGFLLIVISVRLSEAHVRENTLCSFGLEPDLQCRHIQEAIPGDGSKLGRDRKLFCITTHEWT
ncbi:hypothetical protein AAFF_G00154430 [Aldrovandia affinis]|uniref:Uncharacterized protein n=1 Tax=Aldrovandia affinis TaxID=143900 RepID=A0AAD7T032_9TELE|nr:hypothetical protein AAFF_G00154430 [Aldrovandia affinis]